MADKEYFGKVTKYKYVPDKNGKRGGIGFGFIVCLETGEEFYVHREAILTKPETTLAPRLYRFEKVAFTVYEDTEQEQMYRNDHRQQQRDQKKPRLRRVKCVYGIMGSTLRVDDESEFKKFREENRKARSPEGARTSSTQTQTEPTQSK